MKNLVFVSGTPQEQTQAALPHAEIQQRKEILGNALVDFCESLKKMRDSRLYTLLGYDDFGKYCEESHGIRQRMAYKYIKAYEDNGRKFMEEHSSAGITKLALLGEVMAPEREEIAKNNNLEEMSVQELKKALAEINGLREQISFLEDTKKSDKDRLAEAQEQLQRAQEELQAMKSAPIEIQSAQVDEEVIRAEERKKAADEKAALQKEKEQQWRKFEDEKAEMQEKHAEELKAAVEKAEEQATARINMELSIAQQEADTAKKEVERLEKELALKNSKSGAEVNNLFDKLQNIFFAILDGVEQMAKQDAEQAQKLKNATQKALQAMIEQMEELTDE